MGGRKGFGVGGDVVEMQVRVLTQKQDCKVQLTDAGDMQERGGSLQ